MNTPNRAFLSLCFVNPGEESPFLHRENAMTPKKRKLWIILGSVVILVVIIRLILPYVVLRLVNDRLTRIKGYYGHVNDIDIALLRGAYKLDSIYINKLDSNTNKQTPFFSAGEVDLSIEWKALFKGSIVGEMVFERPMITFTKDKVEPKKVTKDSSSFRNLKEDLMPLQINRVEINHGVIKYRDDTSKPRVDIALTNARILALNLRNSYDSSAELPASVKATADVYGGSLRLNVKLNPLAEEPTFDLNTEIKDTNLVKLNEFFQAYAKIDVNKGKFGLYAEAAGKNGRFKGYVKPLIKDLDVVGKEDRHDNILRKLWESVAGTVGEVFENQRKDQLATKVPFEGSLKDPDSNVWQAIGAVLGNAFIRAIQPSIDQEINLAAVEDDTKKEKKNFLQKVFGKKDKDEKDKDKDKDKDEKARDGKKK
jgi:hypothetical protein